MPITPVMFPAVSPTPPFPLRPIGTYSRIDVTLRIAEGAMGAVYRAVDKDGRPVAVKLLSDRSKTMIDRFMREIAAVEDLDHPNIVQTLGHGEDREYGPFIVMELLTGRTLEEFLGSQRYGRLAIKESVAIASPICGALLYAHSRGLVHRDIKPANIFVCKEDPPDVKVMDFGLARDPNADPRGTRTRKKLTEHGMALGTPEYMAPEQFQGRPVFASDVYSLGIMLYWMVEGGPPFPDHLSTPEDFFHWHVAGVPKKMAECGLPLLEDLVHRMLDKKPGKRPQLSEIAGALNGILQPARPASPTLVQIPIAVQEETARIGVPTLASDAPTRQTPQPMQAVPSPQFVSNESRPHPKAVPILPIQPPTNPAIPDVISDDASDMTVPMSAAPPPPNWTRAATGELTPRETRDIVPSSKVFVDPALSHPVPPPQTKAPKSPRTWWPLKKFSASIQRVLRRFPKG